ncbi:histidinol-phosphatase HisJ [Secundilactobacillus sp. HBUAS58055]|uniref:histidinol-phosphatase HisJ n=1 Tax=Secundilactobacillus angelensis TaxID=2722706 RepID=UPI001B3B1F1E|nr:histidinol-phosphatase HisJ [Secundilactobacillus angelensis]MCH5462483.1 histidinol-phosphatase HisJ [Secundilactobacillus angelensis]
MLKQDGHSHTEFCPHGSGDDVELMIQKAIRLGFERYSITEHAPLPTAFKQEYAGLETGYTEASMAMSDLPAYFKKVKRMQDKYGAKIHINVGFEVDYLSNHVQWTRDFLNEYGPQTTDNVLSVHFMQGANHKFWCVDDTLTDFETGLLTPAENGQALYRQYFRAVTEAVTADLGQYAPKRIGHMTLIRKFQDYFGLPRIYDADTWQVITTLLQTIQQKGDQLDYNAAGLYKEFCNETYPDDAILKQAQQLKIPLVYGSDAHSIKEVGHGYHTLMAMINAK